jgi:hypothetical protein
MGGNIYYDPVVDWKAWSEAGIEQGSLALWSRK